MKVLFALIVMFLSTPAWAASTVSANRTASVAVYFKIVIPARVVSDKIFNQSIPLASGEFRQARIRPDGRLEITLVRP